MLEPYLTVGLPSRLESPQNGSEATSFNSPVAQVEIGRFAPDVLLLSGNSLIEVVVFKILRAFGCQLKRQAFVSQLIHPHTF